MTRLADVGLAALSTVRELASDDTVVFGMLSPVANDQDYMVLDGSFFEPPDDPPDAWQSAAPSFSDWVGPPRCRSGQAANIVRLIPDLLILGAAEVAILTRGILCHR